MALESHPHQQNLSLPSNVAFLPLSLLLIGCGKAPTDGNGKESKPAATLNVRTHTATNRLFERRLTLQGTLEAKRFVNVAARVGGNLDTLWVDEGDSVEAGVT